MRSLVLLLPLLCDSVVGSKPATPTNSLLGYRDEDFVIEVPPSTAGEMDVRFQHAISILREAVAAPPAIVALGSIVVIQQIVRVFRRAPAERTQRQSLKKDPAPPSPSVVAAPVELGLKLCPSQETQLPETLLNKKEDSEGRDYESLYNDLSGQHEDVKQRWELLQVELREQKAYWEARINTQEYQNELAVQNLRETMVGMLEEEKIKLMQSFHKQAEELRARLERNRPL